MKHLLQPELDKELRLSLLLNLIIIIIIHLKVKNISADHWHCRILLNNFYANFTWLPTWRPVIWINFLFWLVTSLRSRSWDVWNGRSHVLKHFYRNSLFLQETLVRRQCRYYLDTLAFRLHAVPFTAIAIIVRKRST